MLFLLNQTNHKIWNSSNQVEFKCRIKGLKGFMKIKDSLNWRELIKMLLKENYSLNLQWPANYKSLSLKILKKVAVLNCKERFREADALTSMRLISFGWRKAWTMQTSEQFYPWNIWLTSKFIKSQACNLTKNILKIWKLLKNIYFLKD